jgi:hypothetical protein
MNEPENTMIEKPKLFITGVISYMAIMHQAVRVAKTSNMDWVTMLQDVQTSGEVEDRKRKLAQYFEII